MIPSMDWQSLSLQVVTTFAHFLWQGVLIGVALIVLLRLCSSRSANTRYVIASVAFALLPLCVGATFAVVQCSSDPIFIAQVATKNEASTLAQSSVSVELPQTEIVNTAIQSGPAELPPQVQVAEAAVPTVSAKSRWSSWLSVASPYAIVVYLVGVAVSLLRLGSSIWTSGRLRRAVKKIEDSSITRIVTAQASRVGLKRIPLFALCDQISVPVVVGILKPTILLPPAILCGLDPLQLAAILSHEMGHIRRYDLLVNLLQRIVEALLFFHPVTWWISRRMSAEREDCCDDLAVAGCGRLEFASALLQMAELCAKNRGLAIGSQLEAMAADGGKQSQLTRRVHRLLGEVDTPRFVLSRTSVVMAIIATLMLSVSVLAFAQTETNKSDGSSASNNETSAYEVTKFARPPERYTHLVYDQSVPDPARGQRPARVVQPLPASGEAVQPATQFFENELMAESLHRIRSTYPTIRLGESIEVKDNSVLLSKSVATADRNLSPQYELRGDLFNPSLWFGDEQLAEVIGFHNVGVSPDGRSIAWYTRTNPRDTSNLGNTSQYTTTLWFHCPDTGTMKLAEGNFAWDNHWDFFESPILRPRFHWLTQDDFVARAGAADEAITKLNAAKEPLQQTEKVNEAQGASHYEGTVLGPDGKPMQGAEVFVIASWNEATKLGSVRDVTDADGKFSFHAADMTWQALGKTMRRGGLIVAKKPGFVPEWMETWGHSRGIFSTGLWGQTKKQTLELQLTHDDVPIRGQLLDVDGNPLAGARMRLTRIMIPRNRDLTAFLEHWSKANVTATFMTGIPYKREINKHFELMDLNSEWFSDANGRFELSGIGRDRMVELEIASPDIITTQVQVMSRDTEEVGILLDGLGDQGKPTRTIYGANFSLKLKPGLTVTGVVRDRDTQLPVAGMWVTNRGYNPLTAPEQTKDAVVTDSNGRFTLRGLNPKPLDYEKDSTRWVSAIPQPGVQYLKASVVFEKNQETVIETVRGIGYRLKVVEEDGRSVNATASIDGCIRIPWDGK